jgi:hypothetical protein
VSPNASGAKPKPAGTSAGTSTAAQKPSAPKAATPRAVSPSASGAKPRAAAGEGTRSQ